VLTDCQARRFAKAMRAALIFSSTSHSINVQKVGSGRMETHSAAALSRHACLWNTH
jgi:hypothetical protein